MKYRELLRVSLEQNTRLLVLYRAVFDLISVKPYQILKFIRAMDALHIQYKVTDEWVRKDTEEKIKRLKEATQEKQATKE